MAMTVSVSMIQYDSDSKYRYMIQAGIDVDSFWLETTAMIQWLWFNHDKRYQMISIDWCNMIHMM